MPKVYSLSLQYDGTIALLFFCNLELLILIEHFNHKFIKPFSHSNSE